MNETKTYLDELSNSNHILQLMIFGDDSVEIQFKDHSLLQLSPCGANYQYSRSTNTGPAIAEQQSIIRQRCRFATSETKSKVDVAIKLRNHFASRPYLPSQFIHLCEGGTTISLYREVACYQWPDDDTTKSSCISKQSNGVIIVEDKNEHAKLSLDIKLGFVSVDFLTTVSPCTSRNTTPNQSPREVKHAQVTLDAPPKREYIWLKHLFTVQCCPERWKYPFSLAMAIVNTDCGVSEVRSVTPCPKPLPSVCKNQFKHIWRSFLCNDNSQDATQQCNDNVKLKFLWTNNVSFWLTINNKNDDETSCHITIWLEDGSVINSHTMGKYYFRHTNLPPREPNYLKETERIYSPTSLPINPTLKATILRAIRLLTYQEQDNISSSTQTCWQDASVLSLSLEEQLNEIYQDDIPILGLNKKELSENIAIPSLGNFSAFGGTIQIKYNDGTIVHCAVKEQQLIALKTHSAELSKISCRILQPEGQYAVCHDLTLHGAKLAPYVKPLCDWLEWLAKSPEQKVKTPFYSDTIYAPQKSDMIHSELDKINRFNYLCQNHSTLSNSSLENSADSENINPSLVSTNLNNISNISSNSYTFSTKEPPYNPMCPQSVESVLKNTNNAIADIDSFISEFRCKI